MLAMLMTLHTLMTSQSKLKPVVYIYRTHLNRVYKSRIETGGRLGVVPPPNTLIGRLIIGALLDFRFLISYRLK